MHKTISGVTVKDASKGEVSAVFSTFNVVDKDGDLTLPSAIKDGMEVVISAYGHQSHYGALPVGKGVIRTTDTEAILEGKFFMDTTHGADAFTVVKELGELQEWSYSLHDVVRKSAESNGQRYWIIEDIGLIKEVSPVLLGAGLGTRTLAAKAHMSLQDQITDLTDHVRGVIDSAERVVALRAEQGKSLSQINQKSLDELAVETDRLKALLDADAEPSAEATPEDIQAIAATLLRAELFSNLNEGA
jgi:hypothetical protein